jgi:hypothetical protein
LVDHRAKSSHAALLFYLAGDRYVPRYRRNLDGGTPAEPGKEANRTAERSAVRTRSTGMNEETKGHEQRDVDVFALFMVALSIFVAGALIFLVASGMMHYFKAHEPSVTGGRANIPIGATRNFPQPQLEVVPGAALARLRKAEETDLTTYGWVDRNSGIVRIPIDRAMHLLLQRGLPNVGGGQTPLSLQQARPSQTGSPSRLQIPRK